VGLTFGEIPDVAEAELGYLMATLLVDCGDEDATEEYLTPFSYTMPVQLSDRALLQMLLGC
jgi:hypothetical protein